MKSLSAFLAYRHTGESLDDLKTLLSGIRDALAKAEVDVYCTFFDEAKFQSKALGAGQIMKRAFKMIDTKDLLFVVQTSESKSEGMLIEVGYCKAKGIPVIIATKEAVQQTYLPDMADLAIRWDGLEELERMIEKTDFSALLEK